MYINSQVIHKFAVFTYYFNFMIGPFLTKTAEGTQLPQETPEFIWVGSARVSPGDARAYAIQLRP